MVLIYLLLFVFGLTIGSFLTAYTYRLPRGINFIKGRSFCPSCKKQIAWYDNIPLLSYIYLGGKCRNCKKKLSLRYPLIEASTGLIFVLVFYFFSQCASFQGKTVCSWFSALGSWALPYLLLISVIFIAIFIIDFEFQIIPDSLVFFMFLLTFFMVILFRREEIWELVFVSFAASNFFLILNLITKGRGMGLGDVKLALAGGLFLGFPLTILWVFIGFILGAVVGVFLIFLGKAAFGKQIAFGP